MANPLKLASVWRIVSDVDLDGIRRRSHERFEIWICADDEADARVARDLLGGDTRPHPWLRVLDPASLAPPLVALPIAAVLVTRTLDLSASMTGARNALRAQAVPVVAVMVGETGPTASMPRTGEDARVAVTALDASAAVPLASTLLARFDDDRRLALARQLPPLRVPLFQSLIQEVAQANASFALTTGLAESVPVLSAPLALGDVVVLTKNQLLLGYRIVLAAGRDGEPRTLLAEIVGVLGGGLLFRQIAREMVGLIPIAGIPLKVAVAYSGTWAIGRAVALWVTEGRAVTADTLRTMTQEGLERGRAVADRMLAAASPTGRTSRWQRLKGYLPRPRTRDID
jgi:uncharacterized protein (DUF697 family)